MLFTSRNRIQRYHCGNQSQDFWETVMKTLLMAVCVLIGMAALNANAFGQLHDKGRDLYSACKYTVKFFDDNITTPPQTPMPNEAQLQVLTCYGYVSGFVDSYSFYTPTATYFPFCLPDSGSSLDVIARLYVKYIEDNPKQLDEPRTAGLALALHANYPCHTPKPK